MKMKIFESCIYAGFMALFIRAGMIHTKFTVIMMCCVVAAWALITAYVLTEDWYRRKYNGKGKKYFGRDSRRKFDHAIASIKDRLSFGSILRGGKRKNSKTTRRDRSTFTPKF